MPLPKISIVALDLPPEEKNHHQHQHRDTSDPDLIYYVVAEIFLNTVLWFIGFNLKLQTFSSTLSVLISICESINHVFISEWSWLGSILIVPFILWIPIIILAWYSLLETNKWKFLLPYIVYGIFFYYIDAAIIAFNFVQSTTSMEEIFSNPKFREFVSDFTAKRMSTYFGCALFCFIYFAVAKLDRAKVVVEKPEP